MEGRSFWMCVTVMVFAMSSFASATNNKSYHFGSCPSFSISHGDLCYYLNETAVGFMLAEHTCTNQMGRMFVIRNIDNNIFARGFLDKSDAEYMWLGVKFNEDSYDWRWGSSYYRLGEEAVYTNGELSKFDRSRRCSKMGADGTWHMEDCYGNELPFLCEIPKACQDGWFGVNCTERCHCYKGRACQQKQGFCPGGCAAGWERQSCDVVQTPPNATYHCIKTSNGDLQVDFTFHAQGRNVNTSRAVDKDGHPLSCTLPQGTKLGGTEPGWHYTLLLPGAFKGNESKETRDVPSQNDSSSCLASRTGQEMTWFIEFKKYEAVTTGDDITIKVTCDLNDVTEVTASETFVDESAGLGPLEATEKKVQTSVYFVDNASDKPQDRVYFGQTLYLNIDITGLGDNECAKPRNCFIRGQGGEGQGRDLQITNQNGCTVAGTPVRGMLFKKKGDRCTIYSNTFPSFSLGSPFLTVDCQFELFLVESTGHAQMFQGCPTESVYYL